MMTLVTVGTLVIESGAAADDHVPDQTGLFATQLTADNIDALRVGGPDAVAGIGDWVVGNGTICAAVAAADHEAGLTHAGGGLIDLGHCGRNDDQWGVLQSLLNLSRSQSLAVQTMRSELRDGEARIVTEGVQDGIKFETRYAVTHSKPDRLNVRTSLRRVSEGASLFFFGDAVLHGNRQLSPFTLSLKNVVNSVGFQHPVVDVNNFMVMANALVQADTQILVGAPILEPAIAYGWHVVSAQLIDDSGDVHDLDSMGLNGEHFSMLAIFARPPWLGGGGAPGLLELAQTVFMDLRMGEEIVYEREILLSKRADVASLTDRFWSTGPRIHGQIDNHVARIHVRTASDTPVTFVAPDDQGRVSFRLPEGVSGPFELSLRTPDGRRLRRTVAAPPEGVDLGHMTLEPPGVLQLPAIGPVRLIFKGLAPTADPVFGADLMDFKIGDLAFPGAHERNHIVLGGTAHDRELVMMPAGRYRVVATRGPEFSVTEAQIQIARDVPAQLEIDIPTRLLALPGWVSADLHVHAAPSDDATLPVADRVSSFVAESAQVIVSTDHDRAYDYGPTIERLGLGQRVTSMVGSELTSVAESPRAPSTIGHSNAFPLRSDPKAYREGIPNAENVRLRDVVADLRQRDPPALLQLNHPREGGVDGSYGAYLTHLSLDTPGHDPTQLLSAPSNRSLIERGDGHGLRDIDFDAVELLNGGDFGAYALTRADWLSWILQGEPKTGTANSDTHDAARIVAIPRNYVAYDGDLAEDFDEALFVDAIRRGRVFGTTGPLLRVELDGAGPGELVHAKAATLRVSVLAAAWVPVDTLHIYVDGNAVAHVRIRPGEIHEEQLEFDRDAAVFVEVIGRARDSGLYQIVAPGFTPFAFSNHIFVDADGDGQWTAPGLPAELPKTLRRPFNPRPLPRRKAPASSETDMPSAG